MPMVTIQLNHNLYAIIDDDDWDYLTHFHWSARRSHSNIYAIRKETRTRRRVTIFMHRELTHAGPNEHVHHKNGNTLDNRLENLQVITPFEHAQIHLAHRITRKNRADTS